MRLALTPKRSPTTLDNLIHSLQQGFHPAAAISPGTSAVWSAPECATSVVPDPARSSDSIRRRHSAVPTAPHPESRIHGRAGRGWTAPAPVPGGTVPQAPARLAIGADPPAWRQTAGAETARFLPGRHPPLPRPTSFCVFVHVDSRYDRHMFSWRRGSGEHATEASHKQHHVFSHAGGATSQLSVRLRAPGQTGTRFQ